MKEVSIGKYNRISKMNGVTLLFKPMISSVWDENHFNLGYKLDVMLLHGGFIYFNDLVSSFINGVWVSRRVIVRDEVSSKHTKDYCSLSDIISNGGLEHFQQTRVLVTSPKW